MKLSAQPIWQPDVYVLDRKLHVREEHEDEIKDNDTEDNIQLSMASLHQLSSLETVTLAAEIHLLGQLRDRLSPAARYAEKIQSKYRKTGSHTETEAEQAEYLYEGFPFVERGKPLTGLLVIDRYSTVEFESENNEVSAAGQY